MKYYILEGNMKPDIPQGPEFKTLLDAHHAFLDPYFEASMLSDQYRVRPLDDSDAVAIK